MKKREPKRKRGPGKIRGWKGLLASENRLFKVMTAVVLAVFVTALTFMQLGFIGISLGGGFNCYVMALLVPIALAALMFGRGAGFLTGVYAGTVLLFHASMQPLDLYEAYLITPLTSVVLYGVIGYLYGLMFAIALRNSPQGVRRYVYIGIVCFLASIIVSHAFFLGVIMDVALWVIVGATSTGQVEVPASFVQAISHIGNVSMQYWLDFLLTLISCGTADVGLRKYERTKDDQSLHVVFRGWLLVVVFLAFMVTSAIGFVVTTKQDKEMAYASMDGELEYLAGQIKDRLETATDVDTIVSAHDIPEDELGIIADNLSLDGLFEGYTLAEDGTVLLVKNGVIEFSDNPNCPEGAQMTVLYGDDAMDNLEQVSSSGEMDQTIYDARAYALEDAAEEMGEGGDASVADGLASIGYLCAEKVTDDYTVVIVRPSSMVFADRTETMLWTSASAFVLLLAVFVLTDSLLKHVVVRGINETNESLAKITSGDLKERVDVRDNREFKSLSSGINATVDALEGWIAEAETRMERELATAKAIQESALPRTFPPFPEIEAFDIYASMNAAKEVGGDFYDFFLIDDHTLGFLIADVSGKGIPGALFMMAAKTEIENYLSTGMDVDQAILCANRALCAKNDAGMFVTVWAATLDYRTGELNYVNAGHNYPLLRHNGTWQWLKKKCGLFLGTFEVAKYHKQTIVLEEGDELLLYTDGVNEAFNVDEEEFGNNRLEGFLSKNTDLHPREIVQDLRAEVAAWAKGAEQSDDITILALEYGKSPEASGSITIPATLDHIEEAIKLVASELMQRLCPPPVLHKVEIAMEELLVNVCRYAYADQDAPGLVRVSYVYRANPPAITVEFMDQGVPFNPVLREDPTKPSSIQEAKIGGLGIFMVKKTMDDFSYVYDGTNNIVAFRKSW